MTNKRAFRAESGLDAGGHNVQNVADPRAGELLDGVNVQYYIEHNTLQPFSPTRDYDAQFAVHHLSRIWVAKNAITAGPFDAEEWVSTRVDPTWKIVTVTDPFVDGGYPLKVGDYISAFSVNSELDFMLPATPTVGDTIVVQDEGDYCHLRYIKVHTSSKPIDDNKAVELLTIPGSMKMFVYSSTLGGRWICHTAVDGIKTEVVARGAEKYQLSAAGEYYRKSSTGKIELQLPKYANDKDVITTYDLDGLAPVNGTELSVHPGSDHFVQRNGLKTTTSNSTGTGSFVFDAVTKIWNIWDGDIRSRWKPIIGDTTVHPMEQIALAGGTGVVTLTLPKAAANGDSIKFSNIYNIKGVSVKIKVDPTTTHKIIGDSAKLAYPKYKDLPDNIAGMPQVSEVTFTNLNLGAVVEFYYNSTSNVWLAADVSLRIEHVDETNRDRPGVAPLASQAEVDKNRESNPRDDMIVTPKTLANSTATETRRGIARLATAAELQTTTAATAASSVESMIGTIVTPKMLNSRQSTEEIRGVAEVATQVEANTNTNDTHIITPKKFDARRATTAMSGTVRLTPLDGVPGVDRTTAGTGAYDWSDVAHNEPFVLTAKTLDTAQATETARGVAYIATQSEANTQGATTSDVVIITPKKLDARRANDALAGIAEIATQAETNTGTDYTRIVTPKTLNDRRATETLHGLAQIATQVEVDAGTIDTDMVTPLKFKTWQSYDHFTSTRASGIKHTGNLWGKVTLDIDVATETQRGTLEVATQAEANDMAGSDIHVITPKKLSARKATETLTGIAEIATQAEVDAQTIHTHIVTPKTLGAYIHSAANSNMTEAINGTAHGASLAESFVGNDTAGSTQAVSAYNHVPFAVTPRGLNHALQHYLPMKAKAVDSDKLDGLDSSQFLRRDISHNSTGAITAAGFKSTIEQAFTSSITQSHGMFLSATDGRTIIGGGNTTGTVVIRPLGIGSTVANTIFTSNGAVSLSIDPTEGSHATRRSWIETNYYTKTAADGRYINVSGDTMTGALVLSGAANQLKIVDSATSNKEWRLEITGGTLRLVESNVSTSLIITGGGAATFISTVQSTGFKIGSTTVIESDAKMHWNKLKGIPASTLAVQGIVQLNDSLSSTSVTTAATANTIRVLKEILDEKAGIKGSTMDDLKIKNWIRIGNVILRPNASNKTLDFIWTDDPI